MANLLLIQPRLRPEAGYPLGLSYLAAQLTAAGHRVTGVDLSFESAVELEKRLRIRKPDAILVTAMISGRANVLRLCRRLKSVSSAPIILGGPLPTDHPEAIGDGNGIAAMVRGEADSSIRSVVDSLAAGRAPKGPGVLCPLREELNDRRGRSFMLRGQTILGRPLIVRDLDRLPRADRSVFAPRRYGYLVRCGAVPYGVMITSRGCAPGCPLCRMSGRFPLPWRPRSGESVLDEMCALRRDHGLESIHFEDDDLAGKTPGRIRELCEAFLRSTVPCPWECANGLWPARTTVSTIRLMGRAGCCGLVLRLSDVDFTSRRRFEHLESLVEAAADHAIRLSGQIILGVAGRGLEADGNWVARSRRVRLTDVHYDLAPGIDRRPDAARYRSLRRRAHVAFYLDARRLMGILRDVAAQPRLGPMLVRRAAGLLLDRR